MSTEAPLDVPTEPSLQEGETTFVDEVSEGLNPEEFPDYRIPQIPSSEQDSNSEIAMTARELRDRYNGNFRDTKAKEFWAERQKIRTERNETSFNDELKSGEIESARWGYKGELTSDLQRLSSQIDYHAQTAKDEDSALSLEVNRTRAAIKARSFPEKIFAAAKKYLPFLGEDTDLSKLAELEVARLELASNSAAKEKDLLAKVEEVRLAAEAKSAAKEAEVEEKFTVLRENERVEKQTAYTTLRSNLRKNIAEVNSATKLSADRTAELLAEGSLDVSKLAVETNSVVLHAIPYPGYLNTHADLVGEAYLNSSIDTKKASTEEKIRIVDEDKPDLAVSIVSLDPTDENQRTTYPFGLVVDGKIVASYNEDVSTVTNGDARRRTDKETLQEDPVAAFTQNSKTSAGKYGWNESILHQPNIKGVFVDGRGQKNIYYEGGVAGLVEYAKNEYPNLPIYIQQHDGFYTSEGVKVTAEDIYGTSTSNSTFKQ